MKEIYIYDSKNVHVYICGPAKRLKHQKKRKTKIYMVRRDDKTGIGHLIGLIKFNGAWRQYTFEPEENTMFCPDCMREIADFCEGETRKLRSKWRKFENG